MAVVRFCSFLFLQRDRIARNAGRCTEGFCQSARPAFRHIPVFCPDE